MRTDFPALKDLAFGINPIEFFFCFLQERPKQTDGMMVVKAVGYFSFRFFLDFFLIQNIWFSFCLGSMDFTVFQDAYMYVC